MELCKQVLFVQIVTKSLDIGATHQFYCGRYRKITKTKRKLYPPHGTRQVLAEDLPDSEVDLAPVLTAIKVNSFVFLLILISQWGLPANDK